jgi:hypothetical protein
MLYWRENGRESNRESLQGTGLESSWTSKNAGSFGTHNKQVAKSRHAQNGRNGLKSLIREQILQRSIPKVKRISELVFQAERKSVKKFLKSKITLAFISLLKYICDMISQKETLKPLAFTFNPTFLPKEAV